jgi:hypothetical protein
MTVGATSGSFTGSRALAAADRREVALACWRRAAAARADSDWAAAADAAVAAATATAAPIEVEAVPELRLKRICRPVAEVGREAEEDAAPPADAMQASAEARSLRSIIFAKNSLVE